MEPQTETVLTLLLSEKQLRTYKRTAKACEIAEEVLNHDADKFTPVKGRGTLVRFDLHGKTQSWVHDRSEIIERVLTVTGLVPKWSDRFDGVDAIKIKEDAGVSTILISQKTRFQQSLKS